MKNETNFHEPLAESHKIKIGSSRSFGLVFSVVFSVIAFWPLISGQPYRGWALFLGMGFFITSLFFESALKPLNIVWFKFGLFLNKIMNPIIMGFVFIITIVPIGIALRPLGKDPLQKCFDKNCPTYWIPREPVGPAPETMKNQF